MLNDGFGLEVATEQPAVIASIDAFSDAFQGQRQGVVEIFQAAKADPACVLSQVLSAVMFLYLESRGAHSRALRHLAAAEPHLPATSERERVWYAAVKAWADDDIAGAMAAHERLAQDWPEDINALHVGQYHHFNLGRADAMLALGERSLNAVGEVPYLLGLVAFPLEQLDRLGEAETMGRRAIEICRADPWAQHAVCHVMEVQGRMAEGIRFMATHADTWEDCNSFMYTHNWWHLALFHVDSGALDDAVQLFDGHIWGRKKDYVQDQVGAVAMLARLELRGVDVSGRWADVAGYLEDHGEDHFQPFLDLHYVYGLARGGRVVAAQDMVRGMEARAAAADDISRSAWVDHAVPAARGMLAHATGDWARAADELATALPGFEAIGGSHAQRDFFHQVYLDALMRCGRFDSANQLLDARIAGRDNVAWQYQTKAEACHGLGLEGAAGIAENSAQSLSVR